MHVWGEMNGSGEWIWVVRGRIEREIEISCREERE